MKRLILFALIAPALFAQCVWKVSPDGRTRYQDCAGSSSDGVTGSSSLTEVNTIPRISASGVLGLSKLKCPLGVCTLYDDTATTGVTQLNLRAGAGQATLP